MVACEKQTIDSNVAGLNYAEEDCVGTLPVTPIWRPLDPNEYNDFGGNITTLARNPISASRQRKKGVVTDLEASGGFTQDVSQTNLTRLMQGFFFADARERVSTHPINGAAASTIVLTSFVATGSKINVGSGDGAEFSVGMILKSSGMVNPANNRSDMVITAISTDELTVSGVLVDETATADSVLEIVGYQLTTDDASIVFGPAEALTLTRTAGSFIADDFNVGEWIFIGGDGALTKFANNAPGYARIEAVSALSLTLREPTWTPVSESGAGGQTIQIYAGRYIRNEEEGALVKRRSYCLERTLGSDTNGVQSEYLNGAIPNEFTLNLAAADKLTAELSFVALENETRDGTTGVKSGTRIALETETAFNTSSDVIQLRLFVTDPLKATPNSLFAFVDNATLTINNNVSGLKAIGTLGSFEFNVGDFEVGGELEVYFATIEAVGAVKANADVGFNAIFAKDNAGFVYDIPLLSLGGGRVEVSKDNPIKLPLENLAAQNEFGYTLSATYFSYLPTVAMA